MQIFKFLLIVLPLYGCGENINFSVGATKGGSGTGSIPSPSSGEVFIPPVLTPIPSEGDEDEKDVYYVKSKGAVEASCGNASISISPLDIETSLEVPNDQNIIIQPSNESQPANLYFQIKVINNSNSDIYEYFKNCKTNIELQNKYNVTFESTQNLTCTNSESILKIPPQETKIFNYKVTIPQSESYWKILYYPVLSFGNIKGDDEKEYCQILNYEINVLKN